MENNQREERNRNNSMKGAAPMRIWFGIFMVIFYIGIGILLIVANKKLEIFTPTIAIIVGAILCAYGVWRGYRLWKNKP